MPTTLVRVATWSDAGALDQLKRAASLASEEHRSALLSRPALLEVPRADIEEGRVLIATVDSIPVGMASVQRDAHGLELTGLFVAPERWRTGCGRALVEEAVRHFASSPDEPVHVVAGPDAAPFYAACGFAEVGSTATLLGPALQMIRTRRFESPS